MAQTGGAPTKAYLTIEGGDTLPCLYNPKELTLTLSNKWDAASMPGRDVQEAKFNGSSSGTMKMQLQFDTTDTGSSVTTYTDKLVALMKPDTAIQGASDATDNKRPRTVVFQWGSMKSWPAVVEGLTLKFTYFGADGTPLRADVDLSLKQYADPDDLERQNPTSGTPKPHRVHRVQPGETLDRISAHYYGDSTRWRALAVANGLEDPLAVRPGYVLAIPRLGES